MPMIALMEKSVIFLGDFSSSACRIGGRRISPIYRAGEAVSSMFRAGGIISSTFRVGGPVSSIFCAGGRISSPIFRVSER